MSVDLLTLQRSTRILYQEAEKRGWQVEMPIPPHSFMIITTPDGKKHHLFNTFLEKSSGVGLKISRHKKTTGELLKRHGINTPQFIVYKNFEQAKKFLEENKPVVVKPSTGTHGTGITINIETAEKLKTALDIVAGQERLVQKQHFGEDYRLLVVNYKLIAAMQRLPASVKGDGKHTVRELIEIENNGPTRANTMDAPLSPIKMQGAESYLGEKIDTVPEEGEEVRVGRSSNISQGGNTVDVTDEVSDKLRLVAEKIAKKMRLKVCGVDVITEDVSDEQADYVVLETNSTPAIRMHHYPSQGKPRDVAGAILDILHKK